MLSNLKPGFDLYKAFKNKLGQRFIKAGARNNLSSGNPLPFSFPPALEAAGRALSSADINIYESGFGNAKIKKRELLPFCEALGINVGDTRLSTTNIILGNGTTGLYDILLRTIAQQSKTSHPGSIPVILIPTPNYGVFAMQPDISGIDIETFPLREEDEWQVSTEILEKKIREIHATPGRHVALYYHANPHNPTGVVETPERGAALARILKAYDITAIDDMAYWGQEYETRAVPLAVHGLCRSLTIFSISKAFAMPGLRGGFAVGSEGLIHAMGQITVANTQAVSAPTQFAVGAAFSMKNLDAREQYMRDMRHQYQRRYQLVKAIIEGLDSIEGLDTERRREIRAIINSGCADAKLAKDLLQNGSQNFQLVNSQLQSGYFSILKLVNATARYYGEQRLTNSFMISAALLDYSRVLTLPGLSMLSGSALNDCFMITFSFLREDRIAKALCRLHVAANNLTDSPNAEIEAQKVESGLQFDPSWS